ncbi:GIN domain-containing protein [Bacteroidota bacterium]
MKKTLIYILSILSFACNKEFNNNCFENQGDVISEYRELDDFSKIYVRGVFDVIIEQDTTYYSIIEAPENVIPYLETTIENNILNIYDNVKCKFSREYFRPIITIHCKNLTKIKNKEACYIKTNDTIFCDYILISATYKLGEMDLCLKANKIDFIGSNIAFGRHKLSGICNNLYIEAHNALKIDAQSLETFNASIFQNSIADIKLNVINSLEASILSNGNILLENWPDSLLIIDDSGKGEIILMNN